MPQFVYRFDGRVLLNDSQRRAFAITVTGGPDSLVTTATVQIDPREGTPNARDAVIISLGSNGSVPVVFTGEVAPINLAFFPRTGEITCHGTLDRARHPIGIPAGEPLQDDDGNPIPVASYGTASGGADVTDGALVQAVLTEAGVPFDAGAWEEAGWHLGTVLPVTLDRGGTPLDLIQAIDAATHCWTTEGPDGRARRIRSAGLPAGVPNLVLIEGVNVESIQRQISDREVVNRINITGVASDIFTVSDTVEAPSRVSPSTGLPYVPDPPGFRAKDFQSNLLETSENLLEYGTTELGMTNRLEETITCTLPIGNPHVAGGMSIQIFSPSNGLGAGQVGRITGYTHRLSATEYKTDLTVKIGYAAEGVGTNVKPRPSFVYYILRKRTTAGRLYVIVCDASGSTDPDGAYEIPPTVNEEGQAVPGTSNNGIALYEWDSTLGAPVSTSQGGKRAVFVSDHNPTGETITLEVFDYQGAHASSTQTIAFTDQRPVRVRDLWVAIKVALLYTSDGEEVWQRVGIAAVGVCRRAATTYQIAWEEDGTAHRVLTDLTHAPIAVADVSAGGISWVYPSQTIDGRRAWLGTKSGDVYFSGDFGLTWEYKSTIPNHAEITSIGESPFLANQVHVTGGNVLYETFDGLGWTAIYTHPNVGLIAAGYDAGFALGLVVFHGDPPLVDPGAEASRIQERADLVQGDWVRAAELFDLPAGTWRVAYSYQGAGGESALSPVQSVIVAGTGFVARVAPLNPLPPGATGVYYYGSIAPGSSTLRRFAEGSGFLAVDLEAAAPVGGQLPPTANTTLQGIADPTVAPTVVTAAAAAEAPVDFPAQPEAITLGLYDPIAYVAGKAQDLSYQIWKAPADAPFTLERALYSQDYGLPTDIMRDDYVEEVIFGSAENVVFQTVDGFASTVYATYIMQGAEIGLAIGIGPLHAIVARGDLIWVGSTLAALNGIDGEARWVYRLTGDGFSRYAHPLTGGNAANVSLIKAADGSLITWSWEGDRNAIGADNCYRSIDGGATWDLVPIQYAYDVKAGPDGVVYLASQATSDPYSLNTLHRSADNGATFAPVHTVGPSGGVRAGFNSLFISPVDGDVVLSKGWWDGGASSSIRLSIDGGVTFIGTGQESNDQAGLQRGPWIGISPDGMHYYWHRQDSAAFPFKRATLVAPGSVLEATSGHTDAQDPMPFVNALEVAYNYGTFGVYASEDEGATWAQIFGNDQSPTATDHINVMSFVPGDSTNDWYALLVNSGIGAQEYALARRLAAAAEGDLWQDLTPELVDLFPDIAFYAYREAAVRLGTGEVEV